MLKAILALGLIMLSTQAISSQPIENLSLIDHHNLRPIYRMTNEQLRSQTDEAKLNLDKAKEYGIDSYILFSRGFEFLINYDFATPALGDMTNVVFPPDSEHRKKQAEYAGFLNEALDYADKLGIKIVFHTNQFEFPDEFLNFADAKMRVNGRICTSKAATYEAFAGKFQEFFKKFPKCAGVQVTFSESLMGLGDCQCDDCKRMTNGERITKLITTANDAVKPMGKTVSVRTWGGFEKSGVVDALPAEVVLSTKNTKLDFFLTSPISEILGQRAASQEIEYDGWGEYAGYNYYPCYMGEQLAQRIKICSQRGIKRMAIRVNWEHFLNEIFERPWGNEVNIFMFTSLAKNPDADTDSLLREYVAKKFPQSAREAAFNLYKKSWDHMLTWMCWRGENANNHTMVYKKSRRGTYMQNVEYWTGKAIPAGYETVRELIDKRRLEINRAYSEAKELVAALGPDVPQEWKDDMLAGALTMWFVAQENSDMIVMYAARKEFEAGNPLPDLAWLKAEMDNRTKLWQTADAQMYEFMLGDGNTKMYDEVHTPLPEAVK